MSTTLMDRAGVLLRSRMAKGAALAIVPLAVAVQARAASVTLPVFSAPAGNAASGFFQGNTLLASGGSAIETLINNQHVKMTGGIFNEPAIDYASFGGVPLEFRWSGGLSGAVAAGETAAQSYDFDITTTGSPGQQLSWQIVSQISTSQENIDASFTGSLSGAVASMPFSGASNHTFMMDGTGRGWTTDMMVSWSGFSPSDTLTLHIPSNSIDLTIAGGAPAVPAPAAVWSGLGLLGAMALWAGTRRTRWATVSLR